jgi:hypothetical protein
MRDATGSLDAGFVRRVYRTSVIVYAVVGVYVLGYAGVSAWSGLTAGVALALGSLRLIEWSVAWFVSLLSAPAGAEGPHGAGASSAAGRGALLVIAGAKYALLGLVVASVVWLAGKEFLSLPAFVGGVALVHAVIALKAVGAWLVGR